MCVNTYCILMHAMVRRLAAYCSRRAFSVLLYCHYYIFCKRAVSQFCCKTVTSKQARVLHRGYCACNNRTAHKYNIIIILRVHSNGPKPNAGGELSRNFLFSLM